MTGERIVGHGIDLVEVARVARLRADHGERFLARVFTPAEAGYALAHPGQVDQHLAVRFAAKEAVMKALGTGWSRGVAFGDVEVVRGGSGEPGVVLHASAAELAAARGVERWLISLTHTREWAQASAIAVGRG